MVGAPTQCSDGCECSLVKTLTEIVYTLSVDQA